MAIDLNDIDSELLIGEVKKYSVLWNPADDSHFDKIKKRKAALENVCSVFCEDFDKRPDYEKSGICNTIWKRWKNIKDTYIKSRRKNTKSVKTPRKYIYAAQLSFLDTSGARTEIQSSLEETVTDEYSYQKNGLHQQGLEERAEKTLHQQKLSRKRKCDSQMQFIKSPIAAAEPNADRSFFESLIPSIKNFTEDQKLEFRCEVLSLIKRMRKSCVSNNVTSGYASPNHTYAIPNLMHPQFRFANISQNAFPGAPSPQIPSNAYSSSSISSLYANFLPQQNPAKSYSSPNLLNLSSLPFSTRRSTPIDNQYNSEESYSDSSNEFTFIRK